MNSSQSNNLPVECWSVSQSINLSVSQSKLIKGSMNKWICFRVKELENRLEPYCGSLEPLTPESKKELTYSLKVIRADLNSCKDCWEESVARVEKGGEPPTPTHSSKWRWAYCGQTVHVCDQTNQYASKGHFHVNKWVYFERAFPLFQIVLWCDGWCFIL